MNYCSMCGSKMDGAAQFCGACGNAAANSTAHAAVRQAAPVSGTATGGASPWIANSVNSHTLKAVLTTALFSLPLGVIALVHASQVGSRLRMGDYAGAFESSRKADLWANWGIGFGIVFLIVVIAVSASNAGSPPNC